MRNAIPLSLAALMAVGIIVIGCFYLVSPERISGTFGLKPPVPDSRLVAKNPHAEVFRRHLCSRNYTMDLIATGPHGDTVASIHS